MLSQLKTLIGLRVILLKRTWFRSASGIIAGLMAVVVLLMMSGFALGVGIGLFFLGRNALPGEPSTSFLIAGDVMAVLVVSGWLAGLLMELQRSDTIDFHKMLYLPVSLRMVFALNFALSLFSSMLVFYAFGAVGFTAGLIAGVGLRMAWVLPLAAVFYLMLAAWSYHLQGWLAALMENKRRKRLILTLIPIVFVVFSQLPNLLMQSASFGFGRNHDARPEWVAQLRSVFAQSGEEWALLANEVVPLGWLPLGLYGIREGHYGTVGLCFIGMTGIAGAGLAAGYRATYRHHTGVKRRRAKVKKAAEPKTHDNRAPLTARSMPFSSDDTGALVFASWLTLIRHPRIRVQMIVPLLMPLILAAPLTMGRHSGDWSWAKDFAFAGAIFYTLINFAPFLLNQFGADQEGFQALVLLPTPRRRFLLAKNIAFFPLVSIPYVGLAIVIAFFLRSGIVSVVSSLVQFVQVYIALSLFGNFMSAYLPYRFHRTAMGSTRAKPIQFVIGILMILGIPLLMIPAGLCTLIDGLSQTSEHMRYLPVGLLASLGVLAVTLLAYVASLPAAGRVLLACEQTILAKLLKDKE